MRNIIKDKRHFQLSESSDDDSFNISYLEFDKSYHLEIDEPWAGSTDTGFGRTSSLYLSKEELIELADWIYENVK